MIENDNIKVSIELSAYWDVECYFSNEWIKLTNRENQCYDLVDITENNIVKALNHFAKICNRYERRQDTLRNKKLTSFEIRVYIEFNPESDSESNSEED